MSHGGCDFNLPLPPWNKIFFDHLLAQTLVFGTIYAPVPMNWEGALWKGRLTEFIMIRTYGRCGFGIFLQELFCFLFF